MSDETLGGLLEQLTLSGVLRAASHVETLAAADIAAGQDTARRLDLRPQAGKGHMIAVFRIQAQGIKPSNLAITARDLNRSDFRLFLTPDLLVAGLPLIGSASEGVVLDIRNSAARTVDVLIQAAVLQRGDAERILGRR